jgi:hypothetical protein
MYSIHVYFMLTTYMRGWRIIYPLILPPRRVSQKTWCVGHWTTRTNRRWGGLSTRGGFGRLARMLLLFVGCVSRTGLAHNGDHLRAHLRTRLYMTGGWRQWRRCYGQREKEEWRLGAAHATTRGLPHLYGCITCEPWYSAVSTGKRR